jgi:hypothetical protein
MDNTSSEVVCVITRYNENLDWIGWLVKFVDRIIIYNKGDNDTLFETHTDLSKVTVLKIENIGRIDHTIAHYITTHWDTLSDRLIFIPGSILLCKFKERYLMAIVKRIATVRQRFRGFYGPRFHIVTPEFNYTIDNYQAEGNCNKNSNPFIKSEYVDFQAWKNALIDTRPMRYVTMRGMFIICKENIHHIDKSIYQNILNSVSVGDNIENGHFAERIWGHLFRQYSFDSITSN